MFSNQIGRELLLRQVGLIANVKLHFYVKIKKTTFSNLLVDNWGNSIIDVATGSYPLS